MTDYKKTIDDISLKISRDITDREFINDTAQLTSAIQCALSEVLVAMHDSIDRPKGVVPESANKFYVSDYYEHDTVVLSDTQQTALQSLRNTVNAITSCHRHGTPISNKRLNNLVDAQIALEMALRECGIG